MENCIIHPAILAEAKNYLAGNAYLSIAGNKEDMEFLLKNNWLKDTVVIDRVVKRRGRWNVSLVFAHYKDPLLLLVRNITDCSSEKKALTTVFYMKKEAAKDVRGTLTLHKQDFLFPEN